MIIRKLVGGGILLERCGPRQHVLPKTINEGLREGWITMASNRAFSMHTVQGEVVFHIEEGPGRYCLHDGKKLPDEPAKAPTAMQGQAAREYIAKNFPGVESPDPSHPSGYVNRNYFNCTVEFKNG